MPGIACQALQGGAQLRIADALGGAAQAVGGGLGQLGLVRLIGDLGIGRAYLDLDLLQSGELRQYL